MTAIEAPAAADVRAARLAAGLTQTQAGAMVRGTLRAWQSWEAGVRQMPPGLFELFRARVAATAGDERAAMNILMESKND